MKVKGRWGSLGAIACLGVLLSFQAFANGNPELDQAVSELVTRVQKGEDTQLLLNEWIKLGEQMDESQTQDPELNQAFFQAGNLLNSVMRAEDPIHGTMYVNGAINWQSFSFYGYSQSQIYFQCIRFTRTAYIVNVMNLIVNGQVINACGTPVETVCQIISSKAKWQ